MMTFKDNVKCLQLPILTFHLIWVLLLVSLSVILALAVIGIEFKKW